jgi:hypothetical protein
MALGTHLFEGLHRGGTLNIELMLHDYQIVKFLELFGTEAWSILQPETNGRRVSKKKKRVASIAIKAMKGRLATGKKS